MQSKCLHFGKIFYINFFRIWVSYIAKHNFYNRLLDLIISASYSPRKENSPPKGKFSPKGKAISRSVRTFKPDNLCSLGLKPNLKSWSAVYEVSDVDEKVEAFNCITINTFTPLRHVRLNPSDKEWMTPHIKNQIRARQKFWVEGDKGKYQQKCEMVAVLISSVKCKSYERKARDLRFSTRSKWFKYIFSLCGGQLLFQTPTAPSKAELQKIADLLLDIFAAPWKDREPTAMSVKEIANEWDDMYRPPVPNIGQVKDVLKYVNTRKATGAESVPAWLLKRFHEELAPVVHDINCANTAQSKNPTSYRHALVSLVPKVCNVIFSLWP